MRNNKIIIALIAFMPALLSPVISLAGETPSLKARPNVQVKGPLITLGDLFENTGKKASIAVFQAPAPGKTGYINSARLLDAVRRHGLEWKNSFALPRINIARQSRLISPADITASIREKLVAAAPHREEGSSLSLRFTRKPTPIHLPLGINSDYNVSNVNYDLNSGRFSATINTPGNEEAPASQLYYTGRAIRTIKIPVLTRSINRGGLIQLDDVTLKDIPSSRLSGTPMRHISELLGMAATRHLRAGRAIFKRDIEQPQIVKRGALVNIIFKAPGITLSTRGKAVSGGALGDTISVLNVRSKRTIQVKVIAPDTVSPGASANTNTSRTAMAAAPKRGGTYE